MSTTQEALARPAGGRGRRDRLALLAASALCLVFGCHSLGLDSRDRGDDHSGGALPAPASPDLPARYSFRVAPYVFFSDFQIKADQPLFRELAQLRDQVCKELRLPIGSAVVQVYLFESRERYEDFMYSRYPDLPRRRAFFVAQPTAVSGSEDLLVYTFWGEHIRQDLRHELTHALLHSVIRDVPLWLDEGLAEYFELPPEQRGVNAAHVTTLCDALAGTYRPDLARLEGFSDVNRMSRQEYQEAWAWVHLMLRTSPQAKEVLLDYLHRLRNDRKPGLLGPQLALAVPSPEAALEKHLVELEVRTRKGPTAQR